VNRRRFFWRLLGAAATVSLPVAPPSFTTIHLKANRSRWFDQPGPLDTYRIMWVNPDGKEYRVLSDQDYERKLLFPSHGK
jgi:hypothetical protein